VSGKELCVTTLDTQNRAGKGSEFTQLVLQQQTIKRRQPREKKIPRQQENIKEFKVDKHQSNRRIRRKKNPYLKIQSFFYSIFVFFHPPTKCRAPPSIYYLSSLIGQRSKKLTMNPPPFQTPATLYIPRERPAFFRTEQKTIQLTTTPRCIAVRGNFLYYYSYSYYLYTCDERDTKDQKLIKSYAPMMHGGCL
jgi:hypothetical protein